VHDPAHTTLSQLIAWHIHTAKTYHCDGSMDLCLFRTSCDVAPSQRHKSCGAFSEHGYAGIEQKVVKEIAEFVRGKDKD